MKERLILLAEDDPCDVELTLGALSQSNCSHGIEVVRDGEEVLDYLYCRRKFGDRPPGHPVAILLDLKMPKLDGLEALKIIKADDRLRSIPVVMLTSSRQMTDLTECYAQGANAYVVKPVNSGDFSSTVREIGVFWAGINEPPPSLQE